MRRNCSWMISFHIFTMWQRSIHPIPCCLNAHAYWILNPYICRIRFKCVVFWSCMCLCICGVLLSLWQLVQNNVAGPLIYKVVFFWHFNLDSKWRPERQGRELGQRQPRARSGTEPCLPWQGHSPDTWYSLRPILAALHPNSLQNPPVSLSGFA